VSESAVYEGWIRHRRFEPVRHEFRYPLYLMYLDLAELPQALDPYPLWSARRPAPARFRRSDYMGYPERPLAECARDAVEAATGERPAGPVRLLANLRCLGHVFNPVAFYYCFDPAGERVEAMVADVNNIPWGERHPYVLSRHNGSTEEGSIMFGELDKRLHVSPLMGMDQTYSFRAGDPGPTLAIEIESRPADGEGRSFDATMSLRRRRLSRRLMTRILLRYPAMSAQVVGRIYWQALRLRLKGARPHPHPRGARPRGFLSP
jgi:DUF1365 family protein